MRFSSLISWWKRGRPRAEHLHVVVYTRPGCHLCEVAWKCLGAEQARWGFSLTAVDVDGDPELAALYGECVPVIAVNGTVRFRGLVNGVLLRRLLTAETRNRG